MADRGQDRATDGALQAVTGGALVTGSGGGLGREIVPLLAARGYAVHATDLDEAAALETARLLGPPAFASRLDVSDADAFSAAVTETVERAGSLRVLVNNAGVFPTGHGWEASREERLATFGVNAHGVINGTIAALDVMRGAGVGDVINVVSLAGLVAVPGETLYAATKHAALAFSVGTHLDLRRDGLPNIHVSAVCPDGIWTPMLKQKATDPEAALSWSGVLLTPAEVARQAVGLLDHPRPVLSVPRWRGGLVRALAACPGLAGRILPPLMSSSRRRQLAWARKHGL